METGLTVFAALLSAIVVILIIINLVIFIKSYKKDNNISNPIQYDGQGNLLHFDGPNFKAVYNSKSQLVSYRGKDGKKQDFSYNNAGQITRYADNDYWYEYTYNKTGQPLTYIDSKGNGWVKKYNDKGEAISKEILPLNQ